MFYKIVATATLLVLAGALVTLTISLVRTGNLDFASFLIVWVIVGGVIPLWIIYLHGRNQD